jgi:site-specific recombinase XerD
MKHHDTSQLHHCPASARTVIDGPVQQAHRHSALGGWSVFWNRKRPQQPLSVKAIQKKIERYAKTAGVTASCHSLRHTFASNLLEYGAEVVTIRDFLGHSQIASSERYAKVSSQKVKQEYMRTMQKILKQGQV